MAERLAFETGLKQVEWTMNSVWDGRFAGCQDLVVGSIEAGEPFVVYNRFWFLIDKYFVSMNISE
jgi:hypothetical protein